MTILHEIAIKIKGTRAVVRQRSSPAGYILYCNIFIIKPYNIGHTDLDVFVCKSFCHIDIIIQVYTDTVTISDIQTKRELQQKDRL